MPRSKPIEKQSNEVERNQQMSKTFEELLKKSSGAMEQIKKEKEGSAFQKDESFWSPLRDVKDEATFQIRLLPPPGDEPVPYIQYYDHFWKNPKNGRYYVEKSLTSLGKGTKDPMSELNSEAWNSGNQSLARQRARRNNYVCNIYVEKDSIHPENEGKVFRWRYPAQVHTVIMEAGDTELGEDAIDPFHMLNGAPLNLKIYFKTATDADGRETRFPQYEKSKFLRPRPFLDGDTKAMEEVWKQEYPLQELLDFKTYDELKKQLDWVMGDSADHKATVEKMGRRADVERELDDIMSGNSGDTEAGTLTGLQDEPEQPKPRTVIQDDDDIEAMLREIEEM